MKEQQIVKDELEFKTGLQDEDEFPHHDVEQLALARSISKFFSKNTIISKSFRNWKHFDIVTRHIFTCRLFSRV